MDFLARIFTKKESPSPDPGFQMDIKGDVLTAVGDTFYAPAPEAEKRTDKKIPENESGYLPSVFDGTVIIESISIPKKDISNYIKGAVEPTLGPNYYYGYVYKNGVLTFIATLSDRYVEGELSVFSPAILNPGRYCYRRGASFHLVETTEEGSSEKLVYELPEGCIDLNLQEPLDKKDIPSTLWLKWSMKKNNVSIATIMACAFLFSGIICLGMTLRYESVVRDLSKKNLMPAPVVVSEKKPQADLGVVIKGVASRLNQKGTIIAVRAKQNLIAFEIVFSDENEARRFLTEIGPTASYESGIVKFALKLGEDAPPAKESKGEEPAAAANAAPPASTKTEQPQNAGKSEATTAGGPK